MAQCLGKTVPVEFLQPFKAWDTALEPSRFGIGRENPSIWLPPLRLPTSRPHSGSETLKGNLSPVLVPRLPPPTLLLAQPACLSVCGPEGSVPTQEWCAAGHHVEGLFALFWFRKGRVFQMMESPPHQFCRRPPHPLLLGGPQPCVVPSP